MRSVGDSHEAWPPLELEPWVGTCDTLHLWTQVVGKVRLALTPSVNHWWHVPLKVAARGLTTTPIPYEDFSFEVAFDLVSHHLVVATSRGGVAASALVPRSVAAFYREFFALLQAVGVQVHIWTLPVEVPSQTPLDADEEHAAYDPEAANRFFRALVQADLAFKAFQGRFRGKQSPVQFFWGSFDLAQTRFSGRPAPPRRGADRITQEAYQEEVISFGFWPGKLGTCDASFYAYAAPEPPGLREIEVPAPACYDAQLKEFLLPYAAIRGASAPREAVLAFCQSVYDGAATLARWDRARLDRPAPVVGEARETHRL
jgi:hypothetical protein